MLNIWMYKNSSLQARIKKEAKQTINIYDGNIIWISWDRRDVNYWEKERRKYSAPLYSPYEILTFEYVNEHKSRLCIARYTCVIAWMLSVRPLYGQLRVMIVWNWFLRKQYNENKVYILCSCEWMCIYVWILCLIPLHDLSKERASLNWKHSTFLLDIY